MVFKAFRLPPSLADFLAPGVCPFCGSDVDAGRFVCDGCLESAERVGSPMCPVCGEPYTGGTDHPCIECAADKPPFDIARSAVLYRGALALSVWQLKFRRSLWLARGLASFMEPETMGVGYDYDMIVPVPMTEDHMKRRGYNQALELAVAFAELFGFRSRLDQAALVRTRWARSQMGLSAPMRRRNVQGAFAADSDRVRGRKVLVIDDIITTGATARACAQALKRAGAAKVAVISFARRARTLDRAS